MSHQVCPDAHPPWLVIGHLNMFPQGNAVIGEPT
jgi:hypothetical protein